MMDFSSAMMPSYECIDSHWLAVSLHLLAPPVCSGMTAQVFRGISCRPAELDHVRALAQMVQVICPRLHHCAALVHVLRSIVGAS